MVRRGPSAARPRDGETRYGSRSIARFAAEHVATFNDAVARGDFADLLARFADDAVVRFENVPRAGTLEFTGREEYSAAYERQPPDDQIEVTGPVRREAGAIVIPFVWRRDRSAGVLWLTLRAGRIGRMVVEFV